MDFAQFRIFIFSSALLLALPLAAQQPVTVPPPEQNQVPGKGTPDQSVPRQMPPDTKAPANAKPATNPAPASATLAPPAALDRSSAYYHYALAHTYEELVALYGRSEFANRAIDEYKQALAADPNSSFLNAGLAELYFHTSRIRDAINEAQEVIKRDPNNLDARKLLGGIYLRLLGDNQSNAQSTEMLQNAITQYEAILQLDPKDYESHLLLGRLYMLNKNLNKAEAEFKAVLAQRPANEDALSYLTYLYDEEGDSKRATALLENVPEQQRTAKLNAALGYTYEQLHDYKKAVTAYTKAADADPENLDVQRGLASNLLSDGQNQQALKILTSVVSADPQDAQTLLRLAEVERRMGKYEEAYAHLKKAETLVPDSQEVPYNEAVILEAQGRLDEAAVLLSTLIDKGAHANLTTGQKTNRAIFLERLGNIYKQQNKTPQAVETYRKMLELGKDWMERGYSDIIEAYRDARQWPQAIAAAQEAAKALPNDVSMTLVLASQLTDNGRINEGLQLAQAQLHKGSDREVYLDLSQIYSRLRRFPEAEDALRKAEALSPKPEQQEYIQFIWGSLYERQKKYDEAESAFRQVLLKDPQNAMALNYLGYMLAEKGTRLDEALAYVKKAIEQEPQNYAYLDSLGWVYFKLGKYDLAEQYLNRAEQKTGNDGTVHNHLAEVYAKTGRLKQAAAQWERAMQEYNRASPGDNDPTEVAEAQKNLDRARVRLAQQQHQ